MIVIVPFVKKKKGECIMMTYTNKNKFFEYNIQLDTSKNVFQAFLANKPQIFGIGNTIEEATHNLEKIV